MIACFSNVSYAAFPIAHVEATSASCINNTLTTEVITSDNTPNTQPEPAAPRRIRWKSQAWALIICCFAGYLGAHRYYLGYRLEAIIQTLTLGGMGVWWILDLIRICTGDLQPKYGPYKAPF